MPLNTIRDFAKNTWDLDPSNYITSASMNLDGALKDSKQELDLISDPNLYEIMEKSIVGGFVTVIKRRSYANNIYMPNYDPKQLTKFIFSFDFNGLYAGLQRLHLPTGSFKLLDAQACSVFIKKLFELKYIQECWSIFPLKRPRSIHNAYNLQTLS